MYKIPANTLFLGQKLIYVPECHSTNSLLNDLNVRSFLPEGTVVITDNQTAGRGQRGSNWEAAQGLNLTFSLLLNPRFLPAKDQFQLNMAVSLGVAQAIKKLLTQEVKLKWPNDIYVGNKKIGGILIESQLAGSGISSSIVGIGVNINQVEFVYPIADSLAGFTGKQFDLNHVFQKLLESIEAEFLALRSRPGESLKTRYLNSLYKFREHHRFESQGVNFSGTIHDVDEEGRLCVETLGETRRFSHREVKFLQ